MTKVKQEKALSKSEIISALAERSGYTKKDVTAFLAMHAELMSEQLTMKGIGAYTIPFMGIRVVMMVKPAMKARMGRNPATGEEVMIAAKPKRKVVKAKIMKILKDVVMT
jgi:nucleoid DNA-binding protein